MYLFSYTGMGALGLMLCVIVAMLYCCKRKLEPLRFLCLYVLCILPVYLGAKLFGVLSLAAYRSHSLQPFMASDIKNAGIVYYGGLFAYLLYMRLLLPVFYKKKKAQVYDCAALLIPLFHGFSRIGCYFAHCCYGVVSELRIFSVFYEHRVPVQLMEACFELCLFLVLGFLTVRKKLQNTTVARVYLCAYSVFRFMIEFLRGDEVRGAIGFLSFSQWIAAAVLVYLLISCFRKGEASV